MKPNHIVAGAILFAVLLAVILNSSVSSCVPDDSGKCEQTRSRVRIGLLGGGGKGNATLILTQNQDELQDNLLEFAGLKPKSGWGDADSDLDTFAVRPQTNLRRTPDILPLSKLTEVELDRAEAKILQNSRDASLNQIRRLARITQERDRRAQARRLELARQLALQAAPKVVRAPQPAPAPAPVVHGSSDPYNAPAPNGTWAFIEPHTTVWYRINDGWRRVNVWMSANHEQGLTLSIYGPDQKDVWSSKPAGKGTPGNGFDFWWTGRSAFKGVWTIRLTNTTDHSMPYNLNAVAFSETAGDMCRNCHGNIGQDQFDKCEHSGSFCNDLKDEYKEGKTKVK